MAKDGLGVSLQKYLLVIFLVALSAILRWYFEYIFGRVGPFVTFYPAVIFAVLLGDVGPALLAILLSALAAVFLFMNFRTFSDLHVRLRKTAVGVLSVQTRF